MSADVITIHAPNTDRIIYFDAVSVKAKMWLQDHCSKETQGFKYFGGTFHIPIEKADGIILQLKKAAFEVSSHSIS